MAAPGDTGEMIEEMMRHGAAVAQMQERVGNQFTPQPGWEESEFRQAAQSVTAAPHCILVDQSGVRYMSEGGSYMAYCKGMLERNKSVPAVPSWAVFDAQYLRNYILAGTMPGTKKPQRWYDEGYLRTADTSKDWPAASRSIRRRSRPPWSASTASWRRIEMTTFTAASAPMTTGSGIGCTSPLTSLGSITEPPFYAVPVLPGDVGTYGGVVTDEYARVLREDGSVIEGLYATGVSTASVMGTSYPGAGSSVGPSFVWGYVAAKAAASHAAVDRAVDAQRPAA